MKKIFISILVISIVLTNSIMIFASEKNVQTLTKPIITSSDETIITDDGGLFKIIINLKNIEKRNKLIEYFYTPAYWESESIDTQSNSITQFDCATNSKNNLEMVNGLLNLSDEEFNIAFIKLAKDSVVNILALPNIEITNQFIEFTKKYAPLYVDELSNKNVISKKDLALNFEVTPVVNMMSVMSITNMTYTAQGTLNSAGTQIAYIRSVINWNLDTNGNYITYLAPTTTTWLNPAATYDILAPGYKFTEQYIDRTSGMDYAHVHKAKGICSVAMIIAGSNDGIIGYVTINVKLKGNSTTPVADYSTYVSFMGYPPIWK